MKKEELIKQEVISAGGHFYPLVFVDLSVPTAALGAACTYAGRSIDKEINDGKKKFSLNVPFNKSNLVSLILSKEHEKVWIQSISDICL